jgi:REP element-mobilizing transposase RayT
MDIINQSIENGGTYHIFNKGNNDGNVFIEDEDYEYFIDLIKKYILPIADIYSWVLLKNHFHMVIRIREDIQYKWTKRTLPSKELNIWDTEHIQSSNSNNKIPIPVNHLRHFFNAYAHYFNLKYGRKGSLFNRPFKRVLIKDEKQLLNEILYVNSNSVKHGFSENVNGWKWSSVNDIVNRNSGFIGVDYVISLFEDIGNFKYVLKSFGSKYESDIE